MRLVASRTASPGTSSESSMVIRRLGGDGLGDEGVVGVGDLYRLLGREVPEERHLGDAGGVGDLIHRGGVVALALEEVERGIEDARPGAEGARRWHNLSVSH